MFLHDVICVPSLAGNWGTHICFRSNFLVQQNDIQNELWSLTQRSQSRWSMKIEGGLMPPFSLSLNILWEFQFKQHVKQLVTKMRPWSMPHIFDSFTWWSPQFHGGREKNRSFELIHAWGPMQWCTDFVTGGVEGLAITLHIRKAGGSGDGVSYRMMGGWETCLGKHVVRENINFLNLPPPWRRGTLSAVAAAGGPREDNKQGT